MKLPFRFSQGQWLLGAVLLLLTARSTQAQVDNYAFAASNRAYVSLTAAASTRVALIETDDEISNALPLGFSFVFDGTPYTSVYANSNGYLTFNASAQGDYINDLKTGAADERPLAAAFWDDLAGGVVNASRARYASAGTAPNRIFTFEWYRWSELGGTGAILSFEVKLYEGTNKVEFLYNREAGTPSFLSASIGLSGVGTGNGSFLSVSDAVANPSVSSVTENDMIDVVPPTGQVYAFTPPVPSACPTPRNLTATVSGVTANVGWSVTGGGGTFSVIYGPTGFNPATGGTTLGPITGTTASIPNLVPGNYQFYVRQNCPGALGTSNLSNAGSISVPCPSPNGLTAGTLTNTTAAISWNSALTTGATFTVIYGPAGFNPATGGTSVTGITGTSTTLTGLAPNTRYDVYVRQVCLGGGTGTALAGPLAITTPLTAPNNDEPCGAVALGSTTTTGSNVGATTSLQNGINLPACAPSQAPKDVWYSFTTPASGPTSTSLSLNVMGTAAGMVRLFSTPSCSNGPFNQVGCAAATGGGVGINGVITFNNLVPGQQYYLTVSGFGSADPNGTFTLRPTVLGTHTAAESTALRVYPNPSSTGQLTLRREAGSAGQALLYNALGQVVRTLALAAGSTEHTLSTAGLAAGLYTLQVSSNGAVLSRKVVLE